MPKPKFQISSDDIFVSPPRNTPKVAAFPKSTAKGGCGGQDDPQSTDDDTLKLFKIFMDERKKQEKPKKQYKSEEAKQKMLEVLAKGREKATAAIKAKKESKNAVKTVDAFPKSTAKGGFGGENIPQQKPVDAFSEKAGGENTPLEQPKPVVEQPKSVEQPKPVVEVQKPRELTHEEKERAKIAEYLKRCSNRRNRGANW